MEICRSFCSFGSMTYNSWRIALYSSVIKFIHPGFTYALQEIRITVSGFSGTYIQHSLNPICMALLWGATSNCKLQCTSLTVIFLPGMVITSTAPNIANFLSETNTISFSGCCSSLLLLYGLLDLLLSAGTFQQVPCNRPFTTVMPVQHLS